jgi:hypothetical protein
MRLQGVVRPANPSIGACDNNVLAGETQRPHVGRMRVLNARLDRCRSQQVRRRLIDWARFWQGIVNVGIALETRHVRPSPQGLGDLSRSFY